MFLVSSELDGSVIEVLKFDSAERLWFILHCDIGPILLCVCWYRLPAPGGINSISTLSDELSQLRDDFIGTIIAGDLNCHHIRWLYHSSGTTIEGRALHRCSMENGLTQIVKSLTRGRYLLDLVLTDLGESASTKVLPSIADRVVF